LKYSPSSLIDTRLAIYKFLADVLISPIAVPGHDFVDRVFSAPLSLDVLDDGSLTDASEGGRLLKKCAERFALGEHEEMQKEIAIERTRLFRGAVPVHGTQPPPPYEAFYLAPQKEPEHIVKVAKFYHEAGLQLGDFHDRPDYLGLELAFMAELCDRERRSRKNPQNHREILAMEKEFLENHMLRWIPEYCQNVMEFANTDFVKGLIFLLRGFMNEEQEWISSIS